MFIKYKFLGIDILKEPLETMTVKFLAKCYTL